MSQLIAGISRTPGVQGQPRVAPRQRSWGPRASGPGPTRLSLERLLAPADASAAQHNSRRQVDPRCEPRSGERGLAAALVSPAAACAWETGLGPRRVGRGGQETLQRPFSVSSTHEDLSARVCSDPAPAKPRKPCETAPRPTPPARARSPRLLRTPARGAVSGGERVSRISPSQPSRCERARGSASSHSRSLWARPHNGARS